MAAWISHCSESRYLKSGGAATRLRDEGNLKFKRGDIKGSLKIYTESIVCSPEYGPELSLAYGNRSAALYHAGELSACQQDIRLAFKHRYPKDLAYKLHQRNAMCFMKRNQFEEAREAFANASKCIEMAEPKKFPKNKKQSLLKDIKALIEETNSLENSSQEKNDNNNNDNLITPHDEADDLVVGKHEELPGTSAALDVQRTPQKGRFVVTKVDLSAGDILFREAPFASVLLPENYATHCYHCHSRLDFPIPCLKCTQARYCSDECRASSWKEVHQLECDHLELLNSVGVASLAVKILYQTGSEKILSLKPFLNRTDMNLSSNHGFKDEYSKVLELVDHIKDMAVEDVFQYAATATLLSMFLEQRTEFLKQERENEDVWLFLSCLIFKHIGQLICNASAIYEVDDRMGDDDMEETNGVYVQQQIRIATAIYPSYSLMNHSCDPSSLNR